VTLLPPRLLEAAPRIVDMTAEAQREWEEAEMARPVSLDACQIDPAPFQLVERTSLLKVRLFRFLLFSAASQRHSRNVESKRV